MKALVGTFNQEKALVGAFSIFVKTGCGTDRSFYSINQDPLIIKMIRNISQHDGVTKTLFIEFIGDIADAVHRAENDEFVLECVGILGNSVENE